MKKLLKIQYLPHLRSKHYEIVSKRPHSSKAFLYKDKTLYFPNFLLLILLISHLQNYTIHNFYTLNQC